MESVNWIEITVHLLALYAVFKLGQLSIIWPLRKMIRRIAEQNGLDLDKMVSEIMAQTEAEEDSPADEQAVNVERVGQHYYAYSGEGQFLAQGPDFRTMFEVIKQRFPNMNFRVQRMNANLTEEESQRMIGSVLEVFGDKNDNKSNSK